MEPSVPESPSRRYRLERPIAEGGFGAVYEAVQIELGRRVALKLLKSAAFNETNAVERFMREARGTAALEHPNIVRILDHGVDEGVPWIAYELCTGGSLVRLMEAEGRLEWRRAIALVRQVCMGLEAAHHAGILHRDIKPGNILFAETGQVKIADFGLAKWSSGATILTATGALLGTPYYMAPELMSAEASPQSDQYAVAVMFYEMITGQRLFSGNTPVQVLMQHVTADRPRPSAVVASLSAELDAVVLRALATLPGDRFAGMEAFRGALEALTPEVAYSGAAPHPGPPSKPRITRRSGPVAPRSRPSRSAPVLPPPPTASWARRAGLGLGALVAVVGLFVAWRTSRAPVPGASVIPALTPPSSSALEDVNLAKLEAERRRLRVESDRQGLMGALMFQAVGSGKEPGAMREPMERSLLEQRRIASAAERALEPLEAHGIKPGVWPHAVTVVAARLAAEALLARENADRAQRFLPRLKEQNAGDFLGTSLVAMIDQSFSRAVLSDLDRMHDWVAAVATEAGRNPDAAGDQTVWVLLDVIRTGKQFCQTPVEGLSSQQLISHARGRFATSLNVPGEVGVALTHLVPTLFAMAVQGQVPATLALLDSVEADARVLAKQMPHASKALESFMLRVRSVYPPRGAPAVKVTEGWPFP